MWKGQYRVRGEFRGKLFREKWVRYQDKTPNVSILVTEEGLKLLTRLYQKGKLPAKVGTGPMARPSWGTAIRPITN